MAPYVRPANSGGKSSLMHGLVLGHEALFKKRFVFAVGLDSGRRGSHDDITVMELEQYDRRYMQYSESTAAFYLKPGESITIDGTRSPKKR